MLITMNTKKVKAFFCQCHKAHMHTSHFLAAFVRKNKHQQTWDGLFYVSFFLLLMKINQFKDYI